MPDTTNPLSSAFDPAAGSILFIGTATVLIRCAGFTILTDPNFLHRHESVHLGYGLHSRRLTEPALSIEQLPALDLVVLSHFHEDHFDRVAEARLDRSLPVITTPHAAARLEERGFEGAQALRTWETHSMSRGPFGLGVTALPGRHGPPILSHLLPPVMGSMLDFTAGGQRLFRIYITGDTLTYPALAEIPRRYPDIDLMLIHLGGTRVLGLLVTMDAEEGVECMRLVPARTTIPIHYNDYTVFKSSLGEFQEAVHQAGLHERVHYLANGETYRFRIPPDRPGLTRLAAAAAQPSAPLH
ncbi:MAG TPA: MBL fold metallo-hydrolase [Polyangia bacterium]|nr:MBL fold metallo-hydrolase [Polyangia bacterium]